MSGYQDETRVGSCGQCSHCLKVTRYDGLADVWACVSDVRWGELYEVDPEERISRDECCAFDPTKEVR